MSAKANPATDVVVRAQRAYPKTLNTVVSYFGSMPYGQRHVSSLTADKRLVQMQPQDMAQLAMTDPHSALAAQHRLGQLQQQADQTPMLPGQDIYEP